MTPRPESRENQGYDEKENRDKRIERIRVVVEIIVCNGRNVQHEIQLIYLRLHVPVAFKVTKRVVQLGQLRATIPARHYGLCGTP